MHSDYWGNIFGKITQQICAMNYTELYKLIESIDCQCIEVELVSHRAMELEGWLGFYLRNSLLYYASEIVMPEGDNLRERLGALPITSEHPLYRELCGGCPRGYTLRGVSPATTEEWYELTPDTPIRFTLVLIGRVCSYSLAMIEALKRVATGGFRGMKGSSFDLQIRAIHRHQMGDFVAAAPQSHELALHYNTPMRLFKSQQRTTAETYQDKLNHFPSLYQMVLSATHRVAKMATLYGNAPWSDQLEEAIEQLAASTATAQLMGCELRHIKLRSTTRSQTGDHMNFDGLVGYTHWRSPTMHTLIPLLQFCSLLSLGDNTVYGLGDFEVEIM